MREFKFNPLHFCSEGWVENLQKGKKYIINQSYQPKLEADVPQDGHGQSMLEPNVQEIGLGQLMLETDVQQTGLGQPMLESNIH